LVQDISSCSNAIQTTNVAKISQCVNDIYASEKPLEHPVIAHNNNKLEFFHTDRIPSMVINGILLRGDLNEQNMLTDICESITTNQQCDDIAHHRKTQA